VVALAGIAVGMGVMVWWCGDGRGVGEGGGAVANIVGRRKSEYVRPWLILHMKLKCWVCQV
jgi:hypothetical protein